MPVNVDEKIRKLSPAQRQKVEARAEELMAEEMTLRQLRNASTAAPTAASTCSGDEAATVPSSSPVAGLVTSISSPSPRIHSPPMYAS